MKLVFAKEMQSLDQQSAEQIGLPTMVLMENAGKAVAETAADFLEDWFCCCTGAVQSGSAGKGFSCISVAGTYRRCCGAAAYLPEVLY